MNEIEQLKSQLTQAQRERDHYAGVTQAAIESRERAEKALTATQELEGLRADRERLEGLVDHWTQLAGIAEVLASNPPATAPYGYAPSARGQKQAYEDCARDLSSALAARTKETPRHD